MSLFKKPKGKFRSRVTREDIDDDENGESTLDINEFKKTSLQVPTGESKNNENEITKPGSSAVHHSVEIEKKVEHKVKAKLSFGDDEEEDTDVFKVKKSAYSRRIAKQLKREKKKKEKEEKLEEARKLDQSSTFNINEDDFAPEIEEEDNTPVMKDYNTRQVHTLHTIDIEHRFKPAERGEIPSAKEIYAARKKREEDRKKLKMDNVIEDFIAIEDETAAERTAMGLMDDEQPVYEEEPDDDDNEDEDDRIDFAIDRDAIERERAKEAFIQAQEEDEETFNRVKNNADDDSEDELDLWEKEQIRKGVGFVIGSSNRDQSNNQLNELMTKLDLPNNTNDKSNSSIPHYLPKTPNGKAFEELIKQISDSIAQMQREIDEDEQELKSVISEREQLSKEVKDLEKRLNENELNDSPRERPWKQGEVFSNKDTHDSTDDDS